MHKTGISLVLCFIQREKEYQYIQVYRHLERKPIERLDTREAQYYTSAEIMVSEQQYKIIENKSKTKINWKLVGLVNGGPPSSHLLGAEEGAQGLADPGRARGSDSRTGSARRRRTSRSWEWDLLYL